MNTFSNSECETIRHIIKDLTGMTISSAKHYLIQSRVSPLLQEFDFSNSTAFIDKVESGRDPHLSNRFIDALTINETSFFRESHHYDLICHKIIPDWLDRHNILSLSPSKQLRIWSAGCSTGQEAYSIIMAITKIYPTACPSSLHVYGSDVSEEVVIRASKSEFTKLEVSRGLNDEQRRRYFTAQDNGNYLFKDEYRAIAQFKQGSLLEKAPSTIPFDLIFCRNVVIYFEEASKKIIYQNIIQAMRPKAYLISATGESLDHHGLPLERLLHHRARYHQKL